MSEVRWSTVRGKLIAWTFVVLTSLVLVSYGVVEIAASIPPSTSYYCVVVDGTVVYRGKWVVRTRTEGGYLKWWTVSGITSGVVKNAHEAHTSRVETNEVC